MICLAVDEFNDALSVTQSMLSLGKILEKPTAVEIEPRIKEALKLDNYKNDDIPWYWKVASTGSTEKNEMIISNLPPIPAFKQFYHTDSIFSSVHNFSFRGKPPMNPFWLVLHAVLIKWSAKKCVIL